MQPSPFANSTTSSPSPPWMTANNANMVNNNSNFWSNGGFRKRKAAVSDLDEKANQKMFVTEEKMVKEMQTLSLELATLNNSPPVTEELVEIDRPQNEIVQENDLSDDDDDKDKNANIEQTRFELHKLLKDSLKKDDLQDSVLSKLCEIERRKFTMQLVPYMPIHPAQLNSENVTSDDKSKDDDEDELIENSSVVISEEVKNENDDYQFKIPSIPTPYTVEEPCDNTRKRPSAMKRSYSQSNQSNSNLSVTEVKHDGNEQSSTSQPPSAYFIVEPIVTPSCQTSSSTSSSSLSTNDLSVRITEFVENPTAPIEFTSATEDDDVDMQSIASSDTGDRMDDD
ncbi:unnamed protein product [Adineta ricciae]|uniref:Uncharacterized protein n=1 Tax=Adineta ricciae TaxID=249248 RepID=A0A814A137_ADIRI|nr:unnamed protein product [Adineta ricciae]CAF1305864.1 unnamed protein product [Adineta ricciae]